MIAARPILTLSTFILFIFLGMSTNLVHYWFYIFINYTDTHNTSLNNRMDGNWSIKRHSYLKPNKDRKYENILKKAESYVRGDFKRFGKSIRNYGIFKKNLFFKFVVIDLFTQAKFHKNYRFNLITFV